jgi:serine/threonine-protein kinase RsbW
MGREPVVRATIATHVPEAAVWLPVREDSVPVARQTVRAFGAAIGVAGEALEDALIATTEAVTNAIEHAYESDGIVELTLSASLEVLSVTVRDRGRGLESGHGDEQPGFGIPIIESIARNVEYSTTSGGQGTEVVMHLDLGEQDAPASAPERLEAVVRRIVAVVAAQVDIAVASLSELLDIIGRAARGVPSHLVDAAAAVAIDRLDNGFELRVGPLDPAGARELADLASTRLTPHPVDGHVKLSPSRGSNAGGEDLVIRLTAAQAGAARA